MVFGVSGRLIFLVVTLAVSTVTAGTARAEAAPRAVAAPNLCQVPVDRTAPGDGLATADRFDVGNHESGEPVAYDRVVLGLDAPPTSYQVRYVPRLVQDGSGQVVPLRGSAVLEVLVQGARAHDDTGASTLPVRRYTRDWRSLREARVTGDFEGVLQIGLGLSARVDFTVSTLTNPDRLVVDLAMPGAHPWFCGGGAVEVFFFDEPRYLGNIEPFFTPVWRRVGIPAVAGGALTSLFRGPLVTEEAQGLRLISSEATGFTNLRIAGQIARVRLTGGCDAHGSTVTVAGSITPTLKQFPTVSHVKIYDPAGRTADPVGPSDSIPECLNP